MNPTPAPTSDRMKQVLAQLGWRREGSWVIIDGKGAETGDSVNLGDLEAFAAALAPVSPIQPAAGGMREVLSELLALVETGVLPTRGEPHHSEWSAKIDAAQARARALLASTSPAQTGEPAPEKSWGDRDDEWTPQIEAAHPMQSGNHKAYATAMQMVGNRHSKHALVELVCWLLQRQTGGVDQACQHRIADARNPVVKDGYVCVDCGALFRAADHGESGLVGVTMEPLSADELIKIAVETQSAEPGTEGYILALRFARAIEKAHGIGGPK